MVTDGHYTYGDERWVMSRIVESLHCTPYTHITPYVNYTSIKKLKNYTLISKKINIKRERSWSFSLVFIVIKVKVKTAYKTRTEQENIAIKTPGWKGGEEGSCTRALNSSFKGRS